MKKNLLLSLITLLVSTTAQAEKISNNGYPYTPVPFTNVTLDKDSYFGHRLQASRNVTIPLAFQKCQETGRYLNFERAASPSKEWKVSGFSFDDTDVYKTIEGASYLLQTYPDKKLELYIDSVLAIVAKAQEPDGYLYTSRTQNPWHPHDWAGMKRWEKVEELSHEFYNLGHMLDGAVAHYQATGKRSFLDIAIRYADCICREIGPADNQQHLVPGHQIAEMALCRLYLITGDRKYLDQAKYFLDLRGKTSRRDAYSQAHKPVIEQDEAVGHAVRATYMYSGMADVAALTGDSAYIQAIDRIWENIVGRKMYITGGIGSTNNGEAFGANYELPNMTAYCETCAAIGFIYMNYRLFLLHGHAKYFDVLERALYNGALDGVSLDGGRFFYPNPLESAGQHDRKPWFGCACCPSNICRFVPSIPGYFYQVKGERLYVNLFGSNSVTTLVKGKKVSLTQTTAYPFSGNISITVDRNSAKAFALAIRIPGWARNEVVPSQLYRFVDEDKSTWSVSVNGQKQNVELQDGYAVLKRNWKKGDRVEVTLPMNPRRVAADRHVAADRDRHAVTCGPIVYCAENMDNKDFNMDGLILPQKSRMTYSSKQHQDYGFIGGATVETEAQVLSYDQNGYLQLGGSTLRLIPYYQWNHRGPSRMMVWIPFKPQAVSLGVPHKIEKNRNEFFQE